MSYPDPLKICVHLRSKQMAYDIDASEKDQEEIEKYYGRCDTTAYWCDCTQTGRGPDDERVNLEACSSKHRSCFAGIPDVKDAARRSTT